MTGLGALLTLLGTAITNVVIPIRKLTQEESTTDKRSLVDSKPIRRVKYETLIARLGRSGKIPWIDRDIANPGLLREHGRVAIVGWMKSGKTREAAEIIRMATEDGVVSAIYEPTSALDLISEESLSEAVAFQIDDREKTLFFVDELGLRPEVERLERLSQCLETITRLRSDTYYLITIQKERLTDSVRNWLIAHDFHLLGMEALTINQRQELVQTAKKILDFNITPDAVAKLANETDGRPYSLVFTLQQASRETELDQALIEKLLSQSEEEAWAEQRRNIISSEPTAELLLESIVTFISAGVTPRSSSIRQYSYYLSKYQKQRQKFFQLLSDATNQWAKFDIVETEGLFTIPEPLILPLLKDNDQARVKLGDFVRNFEASWFDIFPLKLIEALDLIFNTSAWKNISRRTANFKPPKKYWEFYNSPAWKRAMSWLTDGLFNWPVDRILLKIELGENTSQGNYLFSNALIERGRKAVSEKKFRDSIIYYTKAISLNQNNARAYIYRSLAYRNIGNLDEAIADQTKACEIEPGYSWCVAQRGVSYRLMERYEDAIKDFNQAIQLDNKYDFAIAQRGIVYRLMERYEDAIKDFNQALKLDSEDDLAIAQRGVTYRLMERYEDAIKDFNQALKLDNEDDWTIAQRGVTYRLMERYEDAIKDFNQALKLDNED
ncbi:MAG: tetratricopeptide repeat protein, partial [Cyanobacteria bacterium P01_A01_bin.123]